MPLGLDKMALEGSKRARGIHTSLCPSAQGASAGCQQMKFHRPLLVPGRLSWHWDTSGFFARNGTSFAWLFLLLYAVTKFKLGVGKEDHISLRRQRNGFPSSGDQPFSLTP